MTTFLARKNGNGNYSLTADGYHFGTVYIGREGRVTGGSFQDPEVRDCARRLMVNGMPRKTLQDALAVARRAYEIIAAEIASESAFEAETERLMEARYEYDPEADAFEDWERSQGKLSYEEMRDMAA